MGSGVLSIRHCQNSIKNKTKINHREHGEEDIYYKKANITKKRIQRDVYITLCVLCGFL